MNSAVNVAVTHLWKKMPSGMAKRMFLLTDGSPTQTRTSGGSLPTFLLRKFVAKEINLARKHGIQVYTMIIGSHEINDAEALEMFGSRKYWRRVGSATVGKTLSSLVLTNFDKYLKSRS